MQKPTRDPKKPVYDSEVTKVHNMAELLELLEIEKRRRAREANERLG